MTLITRTQAASCTDKELHSLLRNLFNALTDSALDDRQENEIHISIETIRAELVRRCTP